MLEDESALAEMSETAVPRWQRQQLFKALHLLLGDVDAESLAALSQQLTWHFFNNGDVVYLQGDEPDGMYLVVNGRLRASLLKDDGSVKDLGRIGPGEPVGEMAVITDAERSATVHAVRESNLVHITPAKFQRLIRHHPRMLINIARVIVERQQRIMRGTKAEQAGQLSLVVIPASVDLDALRFAEQLSAKLGQNGGSQALNSEGFDQRYGEELASQTELDDVGNTAVVAFMNELDLQDHYLVYVADPFASAWTRRCIGHADQALVLADPAGNPKPGAAERLLDELKVPLARDLVFWSSFSESALPDVSAWLETRTVVRHFAVQKGVQESMEELARQLTDSG
jgi:CRP-like cAMP-binding protein